MRRIPVHVLSIALFAPVAMLWLACEAPPKPKRFREEVPCPVDDVPEAIARRAAEITASLGPGVRCESWCWDTEDSEWECEVIGLGRDVELDLFSNAHFSELEFVYSVDELRDAAPGAADLVVSTCVDMEHTIVELSLRREADISPDPDFAALWGEEGVFLEIQCPSGHDLEIDAVGSLVTDPDDDLDETSRR